MGGLKHFTVNHSIQFKNFETEAHSNSIEGVWDAVKRTMCETHVKDELNKYLFKYMLRRKNVNTNDTLAMANIYLSHKRLNRHSKVHTKLPQYRRRVAAKLRLTKTDEPEMRFVGRPSSVDQAKN